MMKATASNATAIHALAMLFETLRLAIQSISLIGINLDLSCGIDLYCALSNA